MNAIALGNRPGGNLPVVLDAIEPLSKPDGVQILGYLVIETTGQGGVGTAEDFPPARYTTKPFRGYEFTVRSGPVQVVVGLMLTKEGLYFTPGFKLRYHTDRRAFTGTFHQGVALCSQATADGGCPYPSL